MVIHFYEGIDNIINYSIKKEKAISYNNVIKTIHLVNQHNTMKRGYKPIYVKETNKYYFNDKK